MYMYGCTCIVPARNLHCNFLATGGGAHLNGLLSVTCMQSRWVVVKLNTVEGTELNVTDSWQTSVAVDF